MSAIPTLSIETPQAASRRVMTADECIELLRQTAWGVLSVAERTRDAAVPIGVPTAYAYDGQRLYLAMTEGRKLRALERNPHLCLTVTDVRSLDEWRSVAVIGRPQWVDGDADRTRAIAAFTVHPRPEGHRLTQRDAERLTSAHVLTLDIDELVGYASVAIEDDRDGSDADAAADAMDAVRRIVRALRIAERHSEARLGVSPAALFVLREIGKGALTISELAHRTATGQSSVSEVVARLAAQGLVLRGRSSSDRRRAAITLSTAGRDLLRRAPEAVQEHLLSAFRGLPAREQRQIALGLREWTSASGLDSITATMFFEPHFDAS